MTLAWLESLKGLALVWVLLNHVTERLFGYPLIANPAAGWPPLDQRIAQLAPLGGFGALGPIVNALRYLGWAGDQGVGLFLVASGFGLTWGALGRDRRFDPGTFYRRRAMRLYPAWWAAHLLFLAPALAVGRVRLDDLALPLSLLGLRLTPRLVYYLVPAWWYVGCVLQLYLVFPLLLSTLRRWGPARFLVVAVGGSLALRAAGLALLTADVDWWARGGIALTRLPEFAAGMALAVTMLNDPAAAGRWLRAPGTLLGAGAAYLFGTALALTLPGMSVAPLLLAAGAFVILHAALDRNGTPRGGRWLGWIGRHSYALYLVHQPLVFALVPEGATGARATLGSAAAILLTLVLGIVLERAVSHATDLPRWLRGAQVVAAGSVAVCGLCLLVGAELLIRRVAPQEGGGWGERPSLEASTEFGWRLIPGKQTRLRWDTYDYRVTASPLGFPAPAYPIDRPDGVRRVLVTGDAFSSPEGVDTEAGWVRLLEPLLAQERGQPVQVMNFAITGYGPRQYAAVVERFAPIYRPDLVLVESFVNDSFDALTSDDAFRESIGFGRPSPESWAAVLRFTNLRHLVRVALLEPALERLLGRPRAQGELLGGFEALEGRRASWEGPARAEMVAMFARIERAAAAVGARTAIVMVPAAAQVCTARELPYWPAPFDLADAAAWDVERPQRLLGEIAQGLGAPVLDLRPALRAAPACPYQPHNMHWLPIGHQTTAVTVARWLSDERLLDPVARPHVDEALRVPDVRANAR